MEQYNPIDHLSQIEKVEVPKALFEKIQTRLETYSTENFSKRFSYSIAASIALILCFNFGLLVFSGKSSGRMAFFKQVNSNNELYK